MSGGYAPMAGRVDFGWLNQAWALFSARSGVWISAFLLYFLLATMLWLLWAIPTGVLTQLQQAYSALLHHTVPIAPSQNPYFQFVKTQVFTLPLVGINAVFFGGLYKMALRQARGEAVSALGLFSAFPQALPLLMVAVALAGALSLLEGLCVWLLHLARLSPQQAIQFSSLLATLPTWVAQGLLMFAPLLVVDKGANAADAILGSVRLLGGQWLMAALFYFVSALIGGLGALLCGVGLLASYPLFLLSIAVGYLSFTQPPPPAAYPPYGVPEAPPPGVWPPPPTM